MTLTAGDIIEHVWKEHLKLVLRGVEGMPEHKPEPSVEVQQVIADFDHVWSKLPDGFTVEQQLDLSKQLLYFGYLEREHRRELYASEE